MTLLQKAKQRQTNKTRPNKKWTKEHIALALAWLSGDVTHTQVRDVLKTSAGGVYFAMAASLREAYKCNKLKIKS